MNKIIKILQSQTTEKVLGCVVIVLVLSYREGEVAGAVDGVASSQLLNVRFGPIGTAQALSKIAPAIPHPIHRFVLILMSHRSFARSVFCFDSCTHSLPTPQPQCLCLLQVSQQIFSLWARAGHGHRRNVGEGVAKLRCPLRDIKPNLAECPSLSYGLIGRQIDLRRCQVTTIRN